MPQCRSRRVRRTVTGRPGRPSSKFNLACQCAVTAARGRDSVGVAESDAVKDGRRATAHGPPLCVQNLSLNTCVTVGRRHPGPGHRSSLGPVRAGTCFSAGPEPVFSNQQPVVSSGFDVGRRRWIGCEGEGKRKGWRKGQRTRPSSCGRNGGGCSSSGCCGCSQCAADNSSAPTSQSV